MKLLISLMLALCLLTGCAIKQPGQASPVTLDWHAAVTATRVGIPLAYANVETLVAQKLITRESGDDIQIWILSVEDACEAAVAAPTDKQAALAAFRAVASAPPLQAWMSANLSDARVRAAAIALSAVQTAAQVVVLLAGAQP